MSAEQRAIATLAHELDFPLDLDGDTLRVGDAHVELWPSQSKHWGEGLLALRQAFPSIAHGDQREKLLYKIIQDAAAAKPETLDADFRESLPQTVPLTDPNARQVVAAAIADEYWTTVKRVPYLVPYHSLLPSAFAHTSESIKFGRRVRARYKLFDSVVLPYLCWAGDGVDEDAVAELFDVMTSEGDFTLLDELMLDAAREVAGGAPDTVSVGNITRGSLWDDEVEPALRQGAFCQAELDQFQTDLRTILSLRTHLPRRDLLDLLTALLSFELAVHYYRVAVTLGEQLDRAIATTGGLEPPETHGRDDGDLTEGPLAGRILFRIGTRGDRPVRMTDPCVQSYRQLTEHRLMGMPAAIITMNLTHHLWQALGGAPARADLAALEAEAVANADFARAIDAGAAALAAVYGARSPRQRGALELGEAELVALSGRRPGLFALREAVVAIRRTRLRHTSRDVVNQLAKRESGSLIRTRGPATFFELDENFLFLVVKLICQDGEVDFTTFLHQLTRYGLAPQDEAERGLLADALERLGMLRRYSDAGESIYVHHPIS